MHSNSHYLWVPWYRNAKYLYQRIPLLDYVQKLDHYIILVMNTTVVNKTINFMHIIVLNLWLRISPLVIYITKETRCHVLHPLLYFKLSTNINKKYVIRSIINTRDINIGRRQVISRSRLFKFEARQKYILEHVHGHCNILCGRAWLLCLCMYDFISEYFL